MLRTGKKRPQESEMEGDIIDVSEASNRPITYSSQENPKRHNQETASGVTSGAIPKYLPNFAFPPPITPATAIPQVGPQHLFRPPPLTENPHRGRSNNKSPQRMTNMIRELISEANNEYRANLEERINSKIEEGFKSGFAEIIREMNKLSVGGVVPNVSDYAPVVRDPLRAPEKEKVANRPAPQRRLEFSNNSVENDDLSVGTELPMYTESCQGRRENSNHQQHQLQTIYPKGPMVVDKWGLIFDGNSEHLNVDDFIFRVEYLQKLHGCPWANLLRDFQVLLRGEAREWYWLVIETKEINEWNDLKELLKQEYRTNRSRYEFLRDLEERRQRSGESIDQYFHVMKKLRARLPTPLPENEMIRILKRNMNKNIGQIVFPLRVYTVEQLRDDCKEVEKNFIRRDPNPIIPPPKNMLPRRYVSEVSEELEEEENLVDEIRFPNRNFRTNPAKENTTGLICWNCRQAGHVYMNCPSEQRNLFCYKCGRKDVITPNCPKCSENAGRSMTMTGRSCSTQIPEVSANQLE